MFEVNDHKIRIGYTLGDLGGVGPEIFEKFYAENKTRNDIEIHLIDEDYSSKLKEIKLGKASAISGEHAYQTLVKADKLIKNKELDFLVTGPVAKESLWLAGIQCSGQTELLAKINGLSREEIEMFFVLDNFKVVLATRHVPISDVAKVLEERLASVIQNSHNALKEVFKIDNPKIAVAGLNPHAGENGIIGFEEKNFMSPQIENFKNDMDISGPYPADTLFAQAGQSYLQSCSLDHLVTWSAGQSKDTENEKLPYDLYIAAYHDQVLPLIKGLGGLRAINLTYGLPYTRLSVDHGTGFDIVGKNIASFAGLTACTNYCLTISGSRKIFN